FQAEDGIRDLIVTGVQTCALPICIQFERRSAETSPRLTRPPRARQSGPFPGGQPQAPATYTLLTAEMTADDPPDPRGHPHRAVDHLFFPEPPGRSGPALFRRDHAADAHL